MGGDTMWIGGTPGFYDNGANSGGAALGPMMMDPNYGGGLFGTGAPMAPPAVAGTMGNGLLSGAAPGPAMLDPNYGGGLFGTGDKTAMQEMLRKLFGG